MYYFNYSTPEVGSADEPIWVCGMCDTSCSTALGYIIWSVSSGFRGGHRGHVPPRSVVRARVQVIAACTIKRTASITSLFSPVAKCMCLPLF